MATLIFQLIFLTINICLIIVFGLFTYESVCEQEPRAPRFGLLGVVVHLLLLIVLILFPSVQILIAFYFALLVAFVVFAAIPGTPNKEILDGTRSFVVGMVSRPDEREIVFARNETLIPGSKQYQIYYDMHPEQEERDEKRRLLGGNLGKLGSIDRSPLNIINMVMGSASTLHFLEPNSRPAIPEVSVPEKIDLKNASNTIKSWAKHLGAGLVGICKVDPRWVYSHKGHIHPQADMGSWGEKIEADLSYAIVIATEMDSEIMNSAPHSPVVMETMRNYSKGAFITTSVANYLSGMGYRAVANHASYYEALMVPLAVDAGIGQMSRMGYLISDKYGARMRLAAVLTDMELESDTPVDLGVDEFCTACLKCAESCPSQSIPLGALGKEAVDPCGNHQIQAIV